MTARIYQPTKNAMQSGIRNTLKWILKFDAPNTRFVEPIMGWTGSNETTSNQVTLSFDTLDEAIDYANRNSIDYTVIQPHSLKRKIKPYVQNYKFQPSLKE